jgi:Zn-dependent M28 family amino/carboxypeptidase
MLHALRRTSLLLALLALPAAALAQSFPPRIDPAPGLAALDSATLRRHLVELASDAYEGRGTGTPGEQRAVNYIAREMRRAGLRPGAPDGTFFQRVPLLGSTPRNTTALTLARGDSSHAATFVRDFTLSTDLDAARADLDGELVFVGYGIANPGERWDDFKDVDVRGKILLAFVNDPPATADEPGLFLADTLTYNGRWTYKYEEARRRGAKGIFLIHTAPTAGYPFQVLSATAAREQIQLATPPANPLTLKGWITQPIAERIARWAGTSLNAWFEAAARRDFRPQPLGVRLSVASDFAVRRFEGTNVIWRLDGRFRPHEAVIYTAHHDHLGKDDALIAQGRDGIFNGAVDNASGVAMLLTLAEAFARHTPARPARSLVFATLTAEESGLLGATYMAEHPPVPLLNTIANLNVDSGNLYGPTEDVVGIGAERSDLMGLLRTAAREEGMTVTPDPRPNQGLLYRSDQLAFARGGVPALFFNTGRTARGQAADYMERMANEYNQQRYHQPADEVHPGMRYGGIVQQTRVAYRMGLRLSNSLLRPAWRAGEAFGATREAAERTAGWR